MFTTVAYSESLNTGGVLTYVQAVADPHLRVEGDNIIVPAGMNNLCAVYHVGANSTDCQIESPSLRRTVLLDVKSVNNSTTPTGVFNLIDFFYNPIPLDEYEPLRSLVAGTETDAERKTVIIWLSDGPVSPVAAETYTCAATTSFTAVAYNWVNTALTFTQVLPAGRYAVLGARVFCTSAIAARFVFVGGTWRPGLLCADAVYYPMPVIFDRGGLGVWGEFPHDQPPTLDFLCTTAGSTDAEVFLDLARIG